jgi:trehalose 2-sulfotransferase
MDLSRARGAPSRVNPAKHYLVCTTPRTGSSLLCSLLASTGVAGMHPLPNTGHEYLLDVAEKNLEPPDWETVDLREYLAGTFRQSCGGSEVAGFKLMWYHARELARQLAASRRYPKFRVFDLARFMPEGTRYIWLFRRDVLRQAISFVKAEQTQSWDSRSQGRVGKRCTFDYPRIDGSVQRFNRQNRLWGEFFDRAKVAPLAIAYEDFVRDQAGTVRRILAHLEIPVASELAVKNDYFERQSDATNDEWETTFRRIQESGPLVRAWWTCRAVPAKLLRGIPRPV